MALANSKIDSIRQYLGNYYFIPNYQREYSWEEAELTDFWDDLEHTREEEGEDEHFFGQVVVHVDHKDNDKKYIIDGQQRSITSVIFLRALQLCFEEIYNEYHIENASKKAYSISYKFIGEDENDPYLTLGEQDAEFFRHNIQFGGNPHACARHKKRSFERLRKAFIFFYDKLQDAISKSDDPEWKATLLDEYLDTFTEHFKILYLEADKLDEAFIIFETLNARGRELETADLLKNFIFSKSNNINIAQEKWNKMIETLNGVDPTKFIRHYWNSCHSFTREKELYRSISKNASTPRDSESLLNDLVELAGYYQDLVNPSGESDYFRDEEIRKSISALKTMKASTYYPVILALIEMNFKESDIKKVLERIETLAFRNFVICGLVANSAEILFAKIALSIYSKELTNVTDICREISDHVVTNEEFYNSFSTWTGGESSKETIRYIFRKIHQHLDTVKEVNINNTEVHIEHIMPQSASNWGVDDETHEQFLWRLGNLALLSGQKNQQISNSIFEDKKNTYAESFIVPNREIANYEKWGPDEIIDRQKNLANLAIDIWKK